MSCQPAEIFVYPLLGVVYVTLGICSLLRCKRILRLEWRQAQSFYLLVLLQCSLRAAMLLLSCEFKGHHSFETMQTTPDSVFLLTYLLLFWQLLALFYFAHCDHHFQDSFFRNVSQRPQHSSTSMMFLFLLMVWSGTQVALIVACLLGKVDLLSVQREVAVGNLAVPCTALSCMVGFQLRYSGIPLRGPLWRKKLVKMNLVLFLWSLGRMLSGILSFTGQRQREDSATQSTFDMEMMIIVLVASEVLCIVIVLDHHFLHIFELEEAPQDQPLTVLQETEDDQSLLQRSLSPLLSSSEITVLEALPTGKTNLGQLFLGRFRGKDVVLRRLQFARVSNFVLDGVTQEVTQLQRACVWGLLPCYGAVVEAPTLTIVMPYMPTGSLFALLHGSTYKTRLRVRLEICRQTARVMAEMAALELHHGHLSSHNILLDGDFGAFVADFGLSRVKKLAAVTLGYVCKSAWTSPELLGDRASTLTRVQEADDVYSFGVILWEVLTQQEPFPGLTWPEIAQLVWVQHLRPQLPSHLPLTLVQLALSCWNQQPDKRPAFSLVEETLRKYLEDEL